MSKQIIVCSCQVRFKRISRKVKIRNLLHRLIRMTNKKWKSKKNKKKKMKLIQMTALSVQ